MQYEFEIFPRVLLINLAKLKAPVLLTVQPAVARFVRLGEGEKLRAVNTRYEAVDRPH